MSRITITITILISLFFFSCASAPVSYSPTSTYSENDTRDVTEDDILKAFRAEPQLMLPAKIAWYNMGSDTYIEDYLYMDHENITHNYAIPKSLVEGFSSSRNRYYREPVKIKLKSMRLLAAQAKCDILVLVASKFEEQRSANWTAAFNVLILPAFFTPATDVTYVHEVEVFVFDVRNGYMYKHLNVPYTEEKKFLHFSQLEEITLRVQKELQDKSAAFIREELERFFEIQN